MLPALRLKRFSAAFDELEARARLSDGRESENSATAVEEESSSDLSELVDSFLERGYGIEEENCGEKEMSTTTTTREESERYGEEWEMKRMLMTLIGGDAAEEDGGVRQMICAETETESARHSLGSVEEVEEEEVKRRVISRLRLKGFDAGKLMTNE